MQAKGFVGRSYTARSASADTERTVNLFLERNESESAKSPYSFYLSPGLSTLYSFGSSAMVRGFLPLNGLLWTVIGDQVLLLRSDGSVQTQVGPIDDDGAGVSMAASPSQLVVVSAGKAYLLQSASLAQITWFDDSVTSVGFVDGFFVFLSAQGDGFYFSEPGDANTGDPLNFIAAESSANKYTSLLVDREEVWLFGELAAQGFALSTNPDNPFTPNPSAVIPQGAASRELPIVVGTRVCWFSSSKIGGRVAWTTDGGYLPRRVSNHAVEAAWADYPVSDAYSWAMTISGHDLWRITFPSANSGRGVTWEYDFSVDDWREVAYWNATLGQYEAHRGRVSCGAFDSVIVGDRANGKIYTCGLSTYSDAGDRIRWTRRSPIYDAENRRVSFPWFELDIEPGVGDGTNLDPNAGTVTPEADPQVGLRVSGNAGKTFGFERFRSMGTQGSYKQRVIWRKNGAHRQPVFEVSGSAMVKTVINAAYLRDPLARAT